MLVEVYRIFAQYLMLAILLVIELVQIIVFVVINTTHGRAMESNAMYFFAALEGQLIYTLFYTLCILGPLEMAKIAMIQHNKKMTGLFLCLMSAS